MNIPNMIINVLTDKGTDGITANDLADKVLGLPREKVRGPLCELMDSKDIISYDGKWYLVKSLIEKLHVDNLKLQQENETLRKEVTYLSKTIENTLKATTKKGAKL